MPLIILLFLFIGLLVSASSTLAQDGIPGNCETAAHADVRRLIPRFEANHSRLVLADWQTGATVRVVGEGLNGYRIRLWSPDCRYIAIAEGDELRTSTAVYDVENSVRMGSVPDAAIKLHPITWGPESYLIVESRHGAVLWHVPSGRQSILTQSFNDTRVRNFVQIIWDMPHNQVLATLAMGGRAAFNLATGAELTVTEAAHALLDVGEVDEISHEGAGDEINAKLSAEPPPGPMGHGLSEPIFITAEISNLTRADLTGELTAIIDVWDAFEIHEIRIDPAQDYTDIAEIVNSVRAEGGMRTVTLHDPERQLTIARVLNTHGRPVTRMIWVFTEGLPARPAIPLRIDFTVMAVERGVYYIDLDVHLNPDAYATGESRPDSSIGLSATAHD